MQRGPFAFRHLTEFADVGKIVQDGAEVLGASIIDVARLQARIPSLLDDVNNLARCPVLFT